MPPYVRPAVESRTFLDQNGEVIPYGHQWGMAGPAEDSYSRDSHPERFAPLHDVARALVEHLQYEFDVAVQRGVEFARDLTNSNLPVTDAYRLTPNSPDAAAVVLVLTQYPGVLLRAGVLWEWAYPACGCDACDEVWEPLAEQLEAAVFAITDGRFRESVHFRDAAHSVALCGYRLAGLSAGSTTLTVGDRPDLADAMQRLEGLPDGWQPWPRR